MIFQFRTVLFYHTLTNIALGLLEKQKGKLTYNFADKQIDVFCRPQGLFSVIHKI